MASENEFRPVDGITMYDMTDEEYRDHVKHGGLFDLDHQNCLRSTSHSFFIATTREQLDILVEELGKFRDKMEPRRK